MKKLTSIFFSLIFALNVSAHEFESIREIPWKYTGTAGDLFEKHTVTLEIHELFYANTEINSIGTLLKNSIRGTLKVEHQNDIMITNIDIQHHNSTPEIKSVYLKLNDEFEKNLILTLKYDLISNEYILKEQPYQGLKSRMKLTGKF